MPEKIQLQLSIDSLQQLEHKPSVLLAEASGISATAIKKIMHNGAVWLSRGKTHRRLRRADSRMKVGDVLELYFNPAIQALQPQAANLIHDGGDYSVWHKPSGMLCQGSLWGDHTTLCRFVEKQFQSNKPCFTVHRLDKASSGLVIVAHSKNCAADLAQRFASRQVYKRYQAIVSGAHYAAHCHTTLIDTPVENKSAHTEVTSLREINMAESQELFNCPTVTLLDVVIKTGRKHQIRQHLASIGLPIIGDRLYGSATAGDINLQLRATELNFDTELCDGAQQFVLPMAQQLAAAY